MSEKAVKIAARLYEARDTMRRLLGARYIDACRQWLPFINDAMQEHGCDELLAAIKVADRVNKEGGTPSVVLATAVEMVEGMFALPAIGAVVNYRSTHPAHPGKVAEGSAMVVKYMTAANAPAPHMRPAERMLFVRGCRGPMHSKHFLIKASEVVS